MRTWDFYDVRMPITPLPLVNKPSNSALLGMGVRTHAASVLSLARWTEVRSAGATASK